MMISRGSGPPIVIVPGIQGRWEWMEPAVDALARANRVLIASLAGEPGSGQAFDRALGFDNYVRQVDSWLAEAALDRAEKPFELMVYPEKTHGVVREKANLNRVMVEFFERSLRRP